MPQRHTISLLQCFLLVIFLQISLDKLISTIVHGLVAYARAKGQSHEGSMNLSTSCKLSLFFLLRNLLLLQAFFGHSFVQWHVIPQFQQLVVSFFNYFLLTLLMFLFGKQQFFKWEATLGFQCNDIYCGSFTPTNHSMLNILHLGFFSNQPPCHGLFDARNVLLK